MGVKRRDGMLISAPSLACPCPVFFLFIFLWEGGGGREEVGKIELFVEAESDLGRKGGRKGGAGEMHKSFALEKEFYCLAKGCSLST